MNRTAFVAITASIFLAACGGAHNNGGPTGGTAANVPTNTPKPANKPANKPPEPKTDPNYFKRIGREDPPGWFRLNKDGQAEILGHTKLKAAKPANYEFVYGVTLAKEPGPTEGAKEWEEWGHKATCALLYFIDKKQIDPAQAVRDNADKVAAGVAEPKAEENVAWTALQGGEVVLAALNLSHGTYLVVGVVLDTANLEAHTNTIVKWAQGMKAEIAAD